LIDEPNSLSFSHLKSGGTSMNLKHMIVPGMFACALLLLPGTAVAQEPGPAGTISDASTGIAGIVAPSNPLSAAVGRRAGEFAVPQQQRRGGGLGPVATGALIGAAAALVATAAAARTYGENESGGFCGGCMAQWSVFTVPVGAGVGAIVGYGVKRMRRSVTAVPVFSRKAAAVVVTARF
jgi:hypothetical protein